MIIGNLYIIRIGSGPYEADSKPIIDPDQVLSFTVALQFLKPVIRRTSQIVERLGCVDHDQLATCGSYEVRRKSLARPASLKIRLGVRILEAPDH
jgi:hypothetical protein